MALFELEEGPSGRLRDRAADAGLAGVVSGGRGLVVAQLVPASAAAGRLDVFAVNEASPNRLLIGRGDGTYEDVAAAYGVADPDEHGRGVVAFDANGDGLLDLAWANWEGPHRLCLQSELGLFGDVAPAAFAHPSLARTLVVADFDNDGNAELFLNNIGEPNRLFRVLAGGTLEELDPGPAASRPLGYGAVGGRRRRRRGAGAARGPRRGRARAAQPLQGARPRPSVPGCGCPRSPASAPRPGARSSRSCGPTAGVPCTPSTPARATCARWSRSPTSASAATDPSNGPSIRCRFAGPVAPPRRSSVLRWVSC